MPTNKFQKSLTLIELIISLMIMSVVILATQAMHLTFTNMVQRSIYQGALYQTTSNALERILKDIRDANSIYVEDGENNILTLNNTSQYYFDTDTKQLYYNPDIANPQPTLILENVESFTVTGVKELSPGSNTYRAARITIKAKDPENRIDTVAFLQSLAYCRIILSKPVRLVDNETTPTEPKFFDTIQDAINAADSTYYIVQVSNARSPYAENLTINKNITLKGAFNNRDWSRHLGDPNYETILDGSGSTTSVITVNLQNSAPPDIKISGFTINSGYQVNVVWLDYVKGTFTFNNNTINTNTTTNAKGMYFTNIDNATINIFNNTFIGAATDDESIAINCNIARDKNPTITIANNNISNYNQGITSGHVTLHNNALLTISNNIVRDADIGICDIRIPTFICNNNTINNCSYIGINLITRSSDIKVDVFNNTITQCSTSIGMLPSAGTSANTIIRNNQCIGPGILLGLGTLGDLKIRNNILLGNNNSGGVYTSNVRGKITCSNNIISGYNNYGIYIYKKPILPVLCLSFSSTNDTITNNVNFGIICVSQDFSSFNVRNSILNGNQGVGIQETDCTFTSKSVTYSDTNCSGIDCSSETNIDEDPLFINPLSDFHLSPGPPPSPCINAGDPSILDPDGSRSDMGAYGGPGSADPIGTYELPDDPDTPYIREDIIGTYLN